MPEQRNRYKGSPLRPWTGLSLVAANGSTREIEVLVDTGNPCALIVSAAVLQQFNQGVTPQLRTNFGILDGGWLRVQIPGVGFDQTVLGYGSDAVAQAASASHADFEGLAGLPLLRLMEYGDSDWFWLRSAP